MVDREKLAQRLMATYLEELQEHVGSLNRNLLAMEDGPPTDERTELFNLLFRAAHSLKGASRAVNVELVEQVCHQMEEILGAARDGKLELVPAHYIVLFKSVDAIEDAGHRLRESRDLSDSPLAVLLPELTAAASRELSDAGGGAAASDVDASPAATETAASEPAATASESTRAASDSPEPPASESAASEPTTNEPKTSEPKTSEPKTSETAKAEPKPGAAPSTPANIEDDGSPDDKKEDATPADSDMAAAKSASQDAAASPATTTPSKSRKQAKRKSAPRKRAKKKSARKAAKRSTRKKARKPDEPPAKPRDVPDSSAEDVAADPKRNAAATPLPASRAASAASPRSRAAAASVRVAAEKLDALLAQSGELLVARRRVQSRVDDLEELRQMVAECRHAWRVAAKPIETLTDQRSKGDAADVQSLLETVNLNREALAGIERGLERVAAQLSKDGGLLNQACAALEDEVHRVRMLPFAEACGGLDRAVRDVARATGKQVTLEIGGENVELDRAILEGLKDPLMHLVRNGVDHGIETPEERLAAGKPAEARLRVSASLLGAQVEIVVEDDGRGFDIERIREKARSKGLPEPENDQALARLVFMAGFSTAATVTDISGRGVGLDVVQAQIEALQGSVDLNFTAGEGSRFTLKLPLTLTTTRAIMVRAGRQTYAIPTVSVKQILRLAPEAIRTVGQRHVLTLGGPPIPVTRLADTLQMEPAGDPAPDTKLLVVVMGSGQLATATIVDELLSEQEITIKHLGRRIRHVRHVSGGTLLPSGDTALVLNVANIMRTQFSNESAAPLTASETQPKNDTPRRLLVVDDSVTTRALMQAILESAGYNVQTAADGRFAMEKLDQGRFDLVVSDVDMPRLNGFGLTKAIRKSDRLSRTPVILVTSRGSDEDKARGIEAGADRYIVKADFEGNNLVETIQQLL